MILVWARLEKDCLIQSCLAQSFHKSSSSGYHTLWKQIDEVLGPVFYLNLESLQVYSTTEQEDYFHASHEVRSVSDLTHFS